MLFVEFEHIVGKIMLFRPYIYRGANVFIDLFIFVIRIEYPGFVARFTVVLHYFHVISLF